MLYLSPAVLVAIFLGLTLQMVVLAFARSKGIVFSGARKETPEHRATGTRVRNEYIRRGLIVPADRDGIERS